MAIRPEKEKEGDTDDVVDCGVCVGIEGERIEAEKERKVQRLGDPRRPTHTEVENHNRTHLPYRSGALIVFKAKARPWITGSRRTRKGD